MESYSLLIEVARSSDVPTVRRALDVAGMPFRAGLLAGTPPRVLFYVPSRRLDEARALLGRFFAQGPAPLDEPATDVEPAPDSFRTSTEGRARFPAAAVQIVAAVVLFHVGLVLWILGPWPPGREFFRAAGLVAGRIAAEPWRFPEASRLGR